MAVTIVCHTFPKILLHSFKSMVQSSLEGLESPITLHEFHIPPIIELLNGVEEGFEGDMTHIGDVGNKILKSLSILSLTVVGGRKA